jgi:hypothetical protein
VITQLLSSKSKSSMTKYRSSFFASIFLRRALVGMDIGAAMQPAIAKRNTIKRIFYRKALGPHSYLSVTTRVHGTDARDDLPSAQGNRQPVPALDFTRATRCRGCPNMNTQAHGMRQEGCD